MESKEKLTGVSIAANEMNANAEKAIANYQAKVQNENGGKISRARAIVAILSKSDFAQLSA